MSCRIVWIALLVSVPLQALMAETTLRHDPFVAPRLRPAPIPSPAYTATEPAPTTAWQPQLRAVLQAGAQSFANVDGTVLAVGERLRGYRLVHVGERHAVLARGSRRIELSLE